MLAFLLSEPLAPFTIAIGLLFGLLALEICLSLIGGSLIGDGPDLDGPDLGDVDMGDLAAFEAGEIEFDAFEAAPEVDIETDVAGTAGPLAWLGLGQTPFVIWLGAVLTGFGLGGLGLQVIATELIGTALPAGLAAVPAFVAGIGLARATGGVFARLIPKTESSAQTARMLSRRRGTVTQGTARRGGPAEVRVADRHGNTHYLRAEPLRDGDSIPRGHEVFVLYDPRVRAHRLIDLGA